LLRFLLIYVADRTLRESNSGIMSEDHEYRRQAAECRRMAENAINPNDKQAWLRLADSWLQMLPRQSQAQNWPKPSGEDSKESH
jgi:hypothetical protein